MDSLCKDCHALDGCERGDSVSEIGNVAVLSKLADHRLCELLYFFLQFTCIHFVNKVMGKVREQPHLSYPTLVQVLGIQIAL